MKGGNKRRPGGGAGGASAEALTPTEAQALNLLAAIDPDALTPREALDLIYRWRATLAGG